MGMETALLFCAIRAAETLGTLPYARDSDGYRLSEVCLNAPALVLEVTGNPTRYGSVASCMFQKAKPKARNKIQGRLDPDN